MFRSACPPRRAGGFPFRAPLPGLAAALSTGCHSRESTGGGALPRSLPTGPECVRRRAPQLVVSRWSGAWRSLASCRCRLSGPGASSGVGRDHGWSPSPESGQAPAPVKGNLRNRAWLARAGTGQLVNLADHVLWSSSPAHRPLPVEWHGGWFSAHGQSGTMETTLKQRPAGQTGRRRG